MGTILRKIQKKYNAPSKCEASQYGNKYFYQDDKLNSDNEYDWIRVNINEV